MLFFSVPRWLLWFWCDGHFTGKMITIWLMGKHVVFHWHWDNRMIIQMHYSDIIMIAMTPRITGVSIVYSYVCLGTDQRKHQSSESLAFVRGIHRWPVNSPHKGPVTRKMFPFEEVIMGCRNTSEIPISISLRMHFIRIEGKHISVHDWF